MTHYNVSILILSDLTEHGYLRKSKVGRRNVY